MALSPGIVRSGMVPVVPHTHNMCVETPTTSPHAVSPVTSSMPVKRRVVHLVRVGCSTCAVRSRRAMACNRVLLGWIAFAILCIATGLCTEVTAIDGEVERPFHVLFLAGGSRGDVQPAVSVAAVMKKRGMKCSILAGPEFEDLIGNTGCGFIPTNANYKELMTTNEELLEACNSRDVNRVMDVVGRESDDKEHKSLRQLQALMDRDPADAAIATSVQWSSAILMADAYGIPSYAMFLQMLHFDPDALCSFFDPVTQSELLDSKKGYWEMYRFLWNMFFSTMKDTLEEARRELWGKDEHHLTLRDLLALLNGAHPQAKTLFAFSPSVISVPRHIRAVGYPFPPSMEEGDRWFGASQELRDFIDSGDAPLYLGWGSMSTGFANSPKLTRIVLEATRRTNNRAVIYSGWQKLDMELVKDDEDLYSWAKENTIFLDRVPQDYVFSHAKALVIHGGAGTTAQSLRCGKPIVVSPYLVDQPWWAHRVKQLGVGVETENMLDITTDKLVEAIIRVTSRPEVAKRAQEVAANIAKENGNERIADIVEEAMREYRAGRYKVMPREEVLPYFNSIDLSFCNAYTSWDEEEVQEEEVQEEEVQEEEVQEEEVQEEGDEQDRHKEEDRGKESQEVGEEQKEDGQEKEELKEDGQAEEEEQDGGIPTDKGEATDDDDDSENQNDDDDVR